LVRVGEARDVPLVKRESITRQQLGKLPLV
jgi:hypothetical protein